jgi:hypothetical protein
MFSDAVDPFPGSSDVHAPRMGIEALDLNSQAKGWPRMAAYQGILQSGVENGGSPGSMGLAPLCVRSGKKEAPVEPSAYARLAVAVQEVPWPATMEGMPCRCPPVVVVALPCHLGPLAFVACVDLCPEFFVVSKICKDDCTREFFLAIPTPEGRLAFLHRYCRHKKLD